MIKFIVYKKTFGVQTAKWKQDEVFSVFHNISEDEAKKWAQERADELEIEGWHVKIERID